MDGAGVPRNPKQAAFVERLAQRRETEFKKMPHVVIFLPQEDR